MSFVKTAWNTWLLQWTLPAKIISIAVLLVLILAVVFGIRSCGKKEPKLNQKETIEATQAIDTHNTEKQKEILAASDVREQQSVDEINKGDAATTQAVEDAKHKYDGMTNDELAAELERRANK